MSLLVKSFDIMIKCLNDISYVHISYLKSWKDVGSVKGTSLTFKSLTSG